MNFCLSDLVPPLRWSDAATIPLLRVPPDLPDAWWRSLPMARVLAVLGPERLAELLTAITLNHWPAAAVGDVLPALHVLDPDEADEPCTAIALDRAGSWPGLLALTGHDLRDQPFIQPVPLLHTLFTAVFVRLVAPQTAADGSAAIPNGSEALPLPQDASTGNAEPEPEAHRTAEPESVSRSFFEPDPARGGSAEAGPVEEAAPRTGALASPEPAPESETGAAAPVEPGRIEADPVEADPVEAVADGSVPAGPPEVTPVSETAAEVPEAPEAPEVSEVAPVAEVVPEPVPGEGAPEVAPVSETAPEASEAPEVAESAPEPVVEGPEPGAPIEDLHALIDGVFANAEDKRWAVAQNRLFSDAPASAEALAKLFAVRPEVILGIEADLRRELADWIASDEAAPYREHLARMREVLGRAAPRERLIDAADWHTRELHSLDIPAWQFVLAGLPGYHLVDEWLVEGDIIELRHRTRAMISDVRPPLTINKALEAVSSLGIHPEVSKEWLENVPQLRILGADERPPQRSNGAPALTAERPAGAEPAKAPFRPLKDVSLTRRCFRQPDGRWWLRIDVTSDHLRGAECPLPSGFAAYLGMSPGGGRTVSSAVGELVLSWQDRPVLESLRTLLEDVGAKEGSHLFLTLSDEGVLRARHLPATTGEGEPTAQALRLVGYTASGGTPEQAGRVIATRVGLTGPVGIPDLLTRLRERGDRDLLSLLA